LLAKAHVDIVQGADLISVQSLLCLVIYLITASRITAAHTYIGVACSTALRLGLHQRVDPNLQLSSAQRVTRTRVFLAVLRLDTYLSLVLDLPAFIELGSIEPEINAELRPSTSSRTAYPFDATSENRVKFSVSAKHFELLALTANVLRTVFVQEAREKSTVRKDRAVTVDTKQLHAAEEQFRDWTKSLSFLPAFPEDPGTAAT
jgi:hypothetical protein